MTTEKRSRQLFDGSPPRQQREQLDVTPLGTEKASKVKTRTDEINAAFRKKEADMFSALGRKGPPPANASKKTWDHYLNSAIEHLQKDSHAQNRWTQLEELEEEQKRMRSEQFRFVRPEGEDEEDDEEYIVTGRAKVLRQRRVPPALPPLAMESSRKRVERSLVAAKKDDSKHPGPTDHDKSNGQHLDHKPDGSKRALPTTEKDGRPGSAKKKRLTEDLSTSLGAAVSCSLLPHRCLSSCKC